MINLIYAIVLSVLMLLFMFIMLTVSLVDVDIDVSRLPGRRRELERKHLVQYPTCCWIK